MEPHGFDELEQTLAAVGPAAAIDHLCADLRANKDYTALFYALLMKKRHELGVSPIPTGSAQDLPAAAHAAYEEAIREAGRLVGGLFLRDRNLPQAWLYFRMLGETEPMRQALEQYEPQEGEDLQPIVQIAFYEGVHPKRGLDLILSRFGICNAITTLSNPELGHPADVRQYCLQRLVRALYAELRERLTAEVARQEGQPPAEAAAPPDTPGVVRRLIAGRDWLFGDDFYHIDVSHLSSVVQMSLHLTPCPELGLARELCAYGQRLSGRFLGAGEPPFEEQYHAYDHYLSVLTGENVEQGLSYFREQVEKNDLEAVGTYPAEVLVTLLLRLNRPAEALAVSRKYLATVDPRRLTCPSITELCQQTGDYRTLAGVAREQGDPVHFLAGLLAATKGC
jgi:hypothetical protein